MRKLNKREKILIYVLGGGLLIYGIFNYAYQPMTSNIAEKQTLLNQLNSQSRDIIGLQQKQKDIQKQNIFVIDSVKAYAESMNIGSTPYQEVVSYIGSAASSTHVNVTALKVLPTEAKDGVTKIPYELAIEGKYPDITAFTDMLYKYDKYVYVDSIYLKNTYKIPMTDKVQNGSGALASHITDTWGKDFMMELDKQIPSSILKPATTVTPDQLPIADGSSKMEKVVQMKIKFGMLTTE